MARLAFFVFFAAVSVVVAAPAFTPPKDFQLDTEENVIMCDTGSSGTRPTIYFNAATQANTDGVKYIKCWGGNLKPKVKGPTCADAPENCEVPAKEMNNEAWDRKGSITPGFGALTTPEDAKLVGQAIFNGCKRAYDQTIAKANKKLPAFETLMATMAVKMEATAGMRFWEHWNEKRAPAQYEEAKKGFIAAASAAKITYTGDFKGFTLMGTSEATLGMCGAMGNWNAEFDPAKAMFYEAGGASIQEGLCGFTETEYKELVKLKATPPSLLQLQETIRAKTGSKGPVSVNWFQSRCNFKDKKQAQYCYMMSQNGNAQDRMLYQILRKAIQEKRKTTACLPKHCSIEYEDTKAKFSDGCACQNSINAQIQDDLFQTGKPNQWDATPVRDVVAEVTKGFLTGPIVTGEPDFGKCREEVKAIYAGKQETGGVDQRNEVVAAVKYEPEMNLFKQAIQLRTGGVKGITQMMIANNALGNAGLDKVDGKTVKMTNALKSAFESNMNDKTSKGADYACSGMVAISTFPETLVMMGMDPDQIEKAWATGLEWTNIAIGIKAKDLQEYNPDVTKEDAEWKIEDEVAPSLAQKGAACPPGGCTTFLEVHGATSFLELMSSAKLTAEERAQAKCCHESFEDQVKAQLRMNF